MICRIGSHEKRFYRIDFYNGGIDYQNSGKGSIIYPNYDYWVERFGERKADENGWQWVTEHEERARFFFNYWAPAWLYFKVLDLCDDLEIEKTHADNIVLPLIDFEMADKSLIGDDIRDVARDVVKLRDLFSSLENRYNRVISMKFTTGRLTGMEDDGTEKYSDVKHVMVKVPRAIDPFIENLQRLVRSDVKMNQHVYNSGYLKYEGFKLKQHYKDTQNSYAVILFEYLENHGLLKSKRDGYIKTGKFMSLMKNSYMNDLKAYEDNPGDYLDYESYDHYVADVMGKRITRHYESVTEKIKK